MAGVRVRVRVRFTVRVRVRGGERGRGRPTREGEDESLIGSQWWREGRRKRQEKGFWVNQSEVREEGFDEEA